MRKQVEVLEHHPGIGAECREIFVFKRHVPGREIYLLLTNCDATPIGQRKQIETAQQR
ncbi:hypothetical protein FQZ97_1097180 [compost metagenome]